MKYCIVIPDGAADLPVAALGDKTPLEAAHKPNMDRAAREGLLAQVCTVPRRMEPGSDVAMMSIVGYDPAQYYSGRAPLEAADLGVELGEKDWAFRCNLITTDGHALTDYCSGHITTEEAGLLVQSLNEKLGGPNVKFHTGTGYRHLMVYAPAQPLAVETSPPHQVVGEPLASIYPRGKGSEKLVELIQRSAEVLEGHEVNATRRSQGKNPANRIWLWGEGRRPHMEPFAQKYRVKGAVISAVNLVRGIAKLIGWDIVRVPGITGYLDTDYAAKGRYAIEALRTYDLVLVHVEAPDEAAHDGNAKAKVEAIERVDADIVGPLMAAAPEFDALRIMVLPDHLTTVEQGRHTRGLVPLAMWGAGVEARSGMSFTESYAAESEVVWDKGHDLMASFLHP